MMLNLLKYRQIINKNAQYVHNNNKMAELSALCSSRTLPSWKLLGTNFSYI